MLSIPVFVKVDQLKLGTSGHTLTVKVVGQTSVPQKPNAASSHLRPNRIAKCLVGDETASILFTARNDQVDLMKPGSTVKIDMFKGSMRLVVDKMLRLLNLLKEDNNLSLVEYELVNVEEWSLSDKGMYQSPQWVLFCGMYRAKC
ncbi:unnamed protein product [Brassica oleracea]|uniref:Single-stranded DNA binding protein Ssb-like OB fold domain-containing protein n=2 Tax=Brassica oleracea TaxID=3712 RepID=A0A0D3E0Z3_BRAOL|nr:PREDICTED: uncharacterized protein At4g28440-like [Brassica oleracea var. oleracea]VDD28136.1 unnamed protein product [Brassica oleracea]